MARRKSDDAKHAKPSRRRTVLFAGAALAAAAFAASRLLVPGGEDPFDKLGDTTASQAGVVAGDRPHGEHGDHSGQDTEAVEPADQPIRDPFCPQVVAPGTPAPNCASRPRHVTVDALKLVEVFMEERMPHARVQVGAETKVLHIHEGLGGYTVDSLDAAAKCGEFSRQLEVRRVCAGEEWPGTTV